MNPDPTHLVPHLAVTFADLSARAEQQKQQARLHAEARDDIEKRLVAAQTSLASATEAKLVGLADTEREIAARLLGLRRRLAAVSAARNGGSASPAERAFALRLRRLLYSLQARSAPQQRGGPNGPTTLGSARFGQPARAHAESGDSASSEAAVAAAGLIPTLQTLAGRLEGAGGASGADIYVPPSVVEHLSSQQVAIRRVLSTLHEDVGRAAELLNRQEQLSAS
jgi:hypothetical protein